MKRYQFLKPEIIRTMSKDFHLNPYMMGYDYDELITKQIYTGTSSPHTNPRFHQSAKSRSICFPLNEREHTHILEAYNEKRNAFFSELAGSLTRLAIRSAPSLQQGTYQIAITNAFNEFHILPLFFDSVFYTFLAYMEKLDEEEYDMTPGNTFFLPHISAERYMTGEEYHDNQLFPIIRKDLMERFDDIEFQVAYNNASFFPELSSNFNPQGVTVNVFKYKAQHYVRFSKTKLNKRFKASSPFMSLPPSTSFIKEVF